jgi:hypothetical protein
MAAFLALAYSPRLVVTPLQEASLVILQNIRVRQAAISCYLAPSKIDPTEKANGSETLLDIDITFYLGG